MPPKRNPLEDLRDEMADVYVELVEELTKDFAPERPWHHQDLSPDQQVWRYLDIRDEVMGWLMQVGVLMGWESGEEVLKNLDEMFTNERIVEAIPPDLAIAIPLPLLEAVQSNGPGETAKWLRKLEKMTEGRAAALGLLESARTYNAPEPPAVPPPLPVDVIGSPGWPLYGGAPQEDEG